MQLEHVIVDAETGEKTIVPFTQEEIDEYNAMVAQAQQSQQTPVEKLQAFLAANPDVAALVNS